ncbi:MAG: peptide deformylase [bacterium]
MTVLNIVKYNDKILRTPTKEIRKISTKILRIVDDLLDTMYAQDGVGLAAPQIGESYKIFVIDTSKGDEPLNPIIFINPRIIKKSGVMVSYEGCLSFPQAYTNVRRYSAITIKAINKKGKPFTIETKSGGLLTRAIQHENDHLDGILFIDHARNIESTNEQLASKGLPPVNPQYLLKEEELEKLIREQEEIQKQTEKASSEV